MKLQTDGIDTMSLIRGSRISLSFEDMTEMTAAVGTDNLRPLHAETAVGMSGDCARQTVEIGGPSTSGLELVVRLV